MKKSEFVQKLITEAKYIQTLYNIPWQFIVVQAALETGWGDSHLFRDANNCFGIKALRDWNGPTLNVVTQENLKGRWVSSAVPFRKYGSIQEGMVDYVKFLQASRYSRFWRHLETLPRSHPVTPENVRTLAELLYRAGYSTDPKYPAKIQSIFRSIDWSNT